MMDAVQAFEHLWARWRADHPELTDAQLVACDWLIEAGMGPPMFCAYDAKAVATATMFKIRRTDTGEWYDNNGYPQWSARGGAYRSLGGTTPDRDEIGELFDLQTVQRKLKDAGRFVFIDRVKKNDSFLPSIPASLKYAREALGRLPQYAELQAVLGKYVPELAP